MPPVRPQGEGVGVLGRWRTEESGARCTLDKLGWSGAAPGRGPERRKDCQCFQLSEVSDGPRCRGRRWPDFLRTWARCPWRVCWWAPVMVSVPFGSDSSGHGWPFSSAVPPAPELVNSVCSRSTWLRLAQHGNAIGLPPRPALGRLGPLLPHWQTQPQTFRCFRGTAESGGQAHTCVFYRHPLSQSRVKEGEGFVGRPLPHDPWAQGWRARLRSEWGVPAWPCPWLVGASPSCPPLSELLPRLAPPPGCPLGRLISITNRTRPLSRPLVVPPGTCSLKSWTSPSSH